MYFRFRFVFVSVFSFFVFVFISFVTRGFSGRKNGENQSKSDTNC